MTCLGRQRRSRALCALLVLAGSLYASAAFAQDMLKRASEAYDSGRRAVARGDYQAAARSFAEADSLVPDATALESALQAVLRANDPILAMTLVERAQRTPQTAAMAVVAEAREAFQKRVGKLTAECGAASCSLEIDGLVVAEPFAWLPVGAHAVTLRSGDRVRRQTVEVQASTPVVVSLEVTSPPPPPAQAAVARTPEPPVEHAPSDSTSMLLPVAFWSGVGLTSLLALGSTLSNVDLASRHDEFVTGCQSGGPGPLERCLALREDGDAARARTGILWGVTGTVAAATAVVGFVWLKTPTERAPRTEPRAAMGAAVAVGLGRVAVGGRF